MTDYSGYIALYSTLENRFLYILKDRVIIYKSGYTAHDLKSTISIEILNKYYIKKSIDVSEIVKMKLLGQIHDS